MHACMHCWWVPGDEDNACFFILHCNYKKTWQAHTVGADLDDDDLGLPRGRQLPILQPPDQLLHFVA